VTSVAKKREFISDGLVATGLGIAVPAGIAALCRPGGMLCDLFHYVFDFFLWPYKYVATHLNGEIASAIGAVHDVGYKSSGPEVRDYFLLGIGILEYLVYWFLAGVIVCRIWRGVRRQIQVLWGAPAPRKLTLGGRLNRMGRLLRGAQTNDFGAAVLRAHSAGK